jgi:hypothetical protein
MVLLLLSMTTKLLFYGILSRIDWVSPNTLKCSLIQPIDLSQLDSAFSVEKINSIVKELPLDKAPGTDKFNGMFIKKCWPIIKGGFYNPINEFYTGQADL